jgi:archaemetzincin
VTRRVLDLIPLGPPFPDPDLVTWLARELERRCELSTRVDAQHLLPGGSAPPGADADAALDYLAELRPPRSDRPLESWSLGLTAAPLHAFEQGHVFGEAAVGGAWAIVSIARLFPSDSFLDHELLRERLLKEALHELGHVGGLAHCRGGCIMTPAAGPAEVDARSIDFCPDCRTLLATLDPPLVPR